jgi:hypothetical protein
MLSFWKMALQLEPMQFYPPSGKAGACTFTLPASVNRSFQLGTARELWPFPSGKLNHITGLRVQNGTCFCFGYAKRAEANQMNSIAVGQRVANDFKKGIDDFAADSFGLASLPRQQFNQIRFKHFVLQC